MQDSGSSMLLWTYFQQGGVAMYPLLLCSILSVAVGIDRIIVLCRARRTDSTLLSHLRDLLSGDGRDQAVARCAQEDSPLARVMHAALNPPRPGEQQRKEALERAVSRESGRLEQYMAVLATIGSISPFIGLFGTVLGIMRAFRDIGIAGSAGGAVVAAGIAEALVATAAGLFVAVVAVIAYNHLMTWVQTVVTDTELNAQDLAALLDG